MKEVFEKIIERIDIDLGLDKQDILVDFCCGNGLFTFELKDKVARIIGIDFSQKIIDTAIERDYPVPIFRHHGLGTFQGCIQD